MSTAVTYYGAHAKPARRILLVSEIGGAGGEAEAQLLALAEHFADMEFEVNGLFARQGTNFRDFESKFRRISFARRDWRPLAAESDLAWIHTIADDRLLTDLQRWMPTILSIGDHRFDCPTGIRRLPLWNLKCPFRCGSRICTLCADLRKLENFQFAPFARLQNAARRCDRLALLSPEFSKPLQRNRFLTNRMRLFDLDGSADFRAQYARLTDGLHLL